MSSASVPALQICLSPSRSPTHPHFYYITFILVCISQKSQRMTLCALVCRCSLKPWWQSPTETQVSSSAPCFKVVRRILPVYNTTTWQGHMIRKDLCCRQSFMYLLTGHAEIHKLLLQSRREYKFTATIYNLKSGVRFLVNKNSVKFEEAFCHAPYVLSHISKFCL